jgi:hypothetical protein
MTSSQKWNVQVGDFVEYEHDHRVMEGTIVEVTHHGGVLLVRVQLAKTLFGYSPPESIVTDPKRLRLLSRSQGVQA